MDKTNIFSSQHSQSSFNSIKFSLLQNVSDTTSPMDFEETTTDIPDSAQNLITAQPSPTLFESSIPSPTPKSPTTPEGSSVGRALTKSSVTVDNDFEHGVEMNPKTPTPSNSIPTLYSVKDETNGDGNLSTNCVENTSEKMWLNLNSFNTKTFQNIKIPETYVGNNQPELKSSKNADEKTMKPFRPEIFTISPDLKQKLENHPHKFAAVFFNEINATENYENFISHHDAKWNDATFIRTPFSSRNKIFTSNSILKKWNVIENSLELLIKHCIQGN